MDVYLLWHVHELPGGEEDVKLIGVYATIADAESASGRSMKLSGFRDCPEGFSVSRYALGKDHWTEGYVTVYP